MQFNWVDLVLAALGIYALIDGWQRGFIALLANLISFLGSLWFAVRYHTVVGTFFAQKFGLTVTWTDLFGYLVVGLVSETILEVICQMVVSKLPAKLINSKANSWLGSIASLLNTSVIASFILLLLLSLPLRGTIKSDIEKSKIAQSLVAVANRYGGNASTSVESLAKSATKFLTVEPGSQESIPIEVPSNQLVLNIDKTDEQAMLSLVNHERTSRGIAPLTVNTTLTGLGEAKSRDMFVRHYFSHYDPDGKNFANHLDAIGFQYTIAGENLAYAPDLSTAHQGLMNSEGHRANILDTRFHKIGIGIIDAGIYGKMFTQEFTD